MLRLRIYIILGLFIASLIPTTALAAPHSPQEVPASLQTSGSRTFSETGFTTANYFYKTWKATPNALFVYGMPISQPFIEESISNPGEYYRVQYFERAVLEESPDLAGTAYYVQGRLLGSALVAMRRTEVAFVPVPNPNDGSFDTVTQHTLRNNPAPFADFFRQNGGLKVFGRPLSEQFQEVNKADGKRYWVQYFERQRMEWHPDEPNPQYRILLGLLGSEYRDQHHGGDTAFNPKGIVNETAALVDTGAINPLPSFTYGFNAVLYGEGYGTVWQDRRRVMSLAMNAGMPWIRQQVRWMDLHDKSGVIHWGELDNIVADASKWQTNLLFSVVAAPRWATDNGLHGMPNRANFATYNYFMGQMAARYKGRVKAYEIWNEQNLATENGGTVSSVTDYMDLLVGASQAIKAADPQALIVSGALASTETNWPTVAMSDVRYYDGMFRDPRFAQVVDIVGVHPGGASNPPETLWPDQPGPGPNFVTSREFYFRRVEDVRTLMIKNSLSSKPVWVTEFGWATANTSQYYEYGNQISFDQQADYIVRAVNYSRIHYSNWLTGMFVWNLNFAIPWNAEGNLLHEQASFGVLNGDWSPRPAYIALKNMPK
ncbi:MAG: hypothetical protein DWI30_04115 [Chloroflexi bacterium]|nr:MAG: hypothetical protein DWI30_04115 [Chloroflexota bacterium]